mmetsp:Transcript_13184/g.30970  ORF Transcript_13184/g.30970 Transcript_13184/m.30970 type:complete len:818 (+) Transcript_13184:15-2468(+)|eukprot:CAMPEP_0171071806 /NCGR_PEP_ID=MMETSP0766_2-20121228/10512_1 /TAXON_ID=439317 /ORGANISM="Gambierdiscus australes, Strain CAWD 149" /LENGTH=817 /DNA_ID=CAMNT_0011528359 /DNA_START=11 /DNA_END=2464 /DNA_ORIENTATION=-
MVGQQPPNGLAACVVTFRVRAETAFGDSIVLVGGGSTFGEWDPLKSSLRLVTTADEYPVWTTGAVQCPLPTAGMSAEYKYVRITVDGRVEWEADGKNRRLPVQLAQYQKQRMIVDDGSFGSTHLESFGYLESVSPKCPGPLSFRGPAGVGMRLVVAGDEIAAGHGAWHFDGWAASLGRALHEQYGYDYVNLAPVGMDILIKEFRDRIVPLQPSVVVIAVGLELQYLATCPDYERSGLCTSFLQRLERLVELTWEVGALPILGAPYPHADFGPEQTSLLRHTHESMKSWGLPMLDWLSALTCSNKGGQWVETLCHDPARPNTEGHSKMYAAINTAMFEPTKVRAMLMKATVEMKSEEDRLCFEDGLGFRVSYVAAKRQLLVDNTTQNEYKLSVDWTALQKSLRAVRSAAPWTLKRGVYVDASGSSVCLSDSGCLLTESTIPILSTVRLQHVSCWLEGSSKVLFNDPNLAIIQTQEGMIIINQAGCEYNVHPMWQAVRVAAKALPHGIYEDDSGSPFRTAVISAHGLQSRVKVPAQGAVHLRWKGPLSSLKRIAVLPLGDRCSIRMLMHKIEYDGPCYPFDLTRTTSLADVADMVATGFSDMWNEHLLEYDHEAGRIRHKKWQGLSFAHEVEDGDDPICNFRPVVERMAKRYAGRAGRFDYAATRADSVLFLRTGCASRDEVCDLLTRVSARFPGLHAQLLLISDQPSEEFDGLLGVSHVREHFDPDRMYEDMNYWMTSAHRFRDILNRRGIDARSLYWCPNNLKEAERELKEAKAAATAAVTESSEKGVEAGTSRFHGSQIKQFSHSNLYKLEQCLGA